MVLSFIPSNDGNIKSASPTRSAGPNPIERNPPARAAITPAAASSTIKLMA
jgi:hypothetical protein